MNVLLLSCTALILRLLPPVVSISTPSALTREVGQEVVFKFNASNRILGFNWGIRDGNTNNLKQGLINYDIQAGMKLDDKISSTSYVGRVSFVGNLTKGQAWFKITNLNINDTNQYMAMIFTQGSSSYTYLPVMLIVVMSPLTTTAFYQTSTFRTNTVTESTTTIATTKEILTSEAPTKNYSKNELVTSDTKCTSIIAISVTINVLLVLVVVILVVYILIRKRKTERAANARLSNVKDEELGVYENAHQIEEKSFDSSAPKATNSLNTEKEMYETIIDNRNESKIVKSHRRENDTVGTSLEPVVVNKGHSSMQPQHYQEIDRENMKPSALYESLKQRNKGNNESKMFKEPTTYEPLQPNKAGTEYQSLNNPIKSYPNSESKV